MSDAEARRLQVQRERIQTLKERANRWYGGLMKGGGGIATLAFGIAALVPVAAPAAVVAAAVGGGVAGVSFVLREKELRFLEDLDYHLVNREPDENVTFDFNKREKHDEGEPVPVDAKERS